MFAPMHVAATLMALGGRRRISAAATAAGCLRPRKKGHFVPLQSAWHTCAIVVACELLAPSAYHIEQVTLTALMSVFLLVGQRRGVDSPVTAPPWPKRCAYRDCERRRHLVFTIRVCVRYACNLPLEAQSYMLWAGRESR